MNKTIIRLLSTFFPNQIASFAYRQLTNPQVKKLRPHELEVLEHAQKDIFKFHDFDIQTYTWPGGADKVLLIHGWEGQAGNFADLIEKLVTHNFTVYAFDGPSHGFSSKGKTSLFEFTELTGELIRKFGASKLVSHSFGGVAVAFALAQNQDIRIDRYVLLTTPDKFLERVDDVAQQTGITEGVKSRLLNRLRKETTLQLEDMNVSTYLPKAQVEKALIIHDKNDTVIPISRSRNVHVQWPVSEFVEIEGTGHFRILRTESVLDKTIQFLQS